MTAGIAVRLVLLEPKQANLLDQILAGPLLGVADLGLANENEGDDNSEGNDGSA